MLNLFLLQNIFNNGNGNNNGQWVVLAEVAYEIVFLNFVAPKVHECPCYKVGTH